MGKKNKTPNEEKPMTADRVEAIVHNLPKERWTEQATPVLNGGLVLLRNTSWDEGQRRRARQLIQDCNAVGGSLRVGGGQAQRVRRPVLQAMGWIKAQLEQRLGERSGPAPVEPEPASSAAEAPAPAPQAEPQEPPPAPAPASPQNPEEGQVRALVARRGHWGQGDYEVALLLGRIGIWNELTPQERVPYTREPYAELTAAVYAYEADRAERLLERAPRWTAQEANEAANISRVDVPLTSLALREMQRLGETPFTELTLAVRQYRARHPAETAPQAAEADAPNPVSAAMEGASLPILDPSSPAEPVEPVSPDPETQQTPEPEGPEGSTEMPGERNPTPIPSATTLIFASQGLAGPHSQTNPGLGPTVVPFADDNLRAQALINKAEGWTAADFAEDAELERAGGLQLEESLHGALRRRSIAEHLRARRGTEADPMAHESHPPPMPLTADPLDEPARGLGRHVMTPENMNHARIFGTDTQNELERDLAQHAAETAAQQQNQAARIASLLAIPMGDWTNETKRAAEGIANLGPTGSTERSMHPGQEELYAHFLRERWEHMKHAERLLEQEAPWTETDQEWIGTHWDFLEEKLQARLYARSQNGGARANPPQPEPSPAPRVEPSRVRIQAGNAPRIPQDPGMTLPLTTDPARAAEERRAAAQNDRSSGGWSFGRLALLALAGLAMMAAAFGLAWYQDGQRSERMAAADQVPPHVPPPTKERPAAPRPPMAIRPAPPTPATGRRDVTAADFGGQDPTRVDPRRFLNAEGQSQFAEHLLARGIRCNQDPPEQGGHGPIPTHADGTRDFSSPRCWVQQGGTPGPAPASADTRHPRHRRGRH